MRTLRLVSIVTILWVANCQAAGGATQVDHAATWVARNCDEVTESIFRWPEEVLTARSQGTRVVEIRVSGEFVPDVQVLLHRTNSGVMAHVLTIADGGVCGQLLEIKRDKPDLKVEDAISVIDKNERTETAPAGSELEASLEALQAIRFAPWPGESLFMPSRTTRVRVAGIVDEVAITFQEPEPLAEGVAYWGAPHGTQPELSGWVDEVFENLNIQDLSSKRAVRKSPEPDCSR